VKLLLGGGGYVFRRFWQGEIGSRDVGLGIGDWAWWGKARRVGGWDEGGEEESEDFCALVGEKELKGGIGVLYT
jgi:hypothetical protein